MPAAEGSLPPPVGRFLAALRQFSRIPVPAEVDAGTAGHWPGVGVVVGAAGCFLLAVVSLLLPAGPLTPAVGAVAATVTGVLVTGALHEDSARRQAGVLGLVLLVAAKLSLLAVLGYHSPAGVLAALLGAHALSRLAALLLAGGLAHVGAGRDAAHPLAQPLDRNGLFAALAWSVVPLALLVLAAGLVSLVAALVLTAVAFAVLRVRLQQRARGFTVDALGFAQQVFEIAFYFGVAVGLPR